MFTDKIVEKAARALNLEAGRLRGLTMEDDWESITEGERGGWRLCARAALEAVEEDLIGRLIGEDFRQADQVAAVLQQRRAQRNQDELAREGED